MRSIYFGLMAVGVMSGCAQSVWFKSGASQEDFGRDNLACLQQSQQIESRSGTAASLNSSYGAYESKSRTGAVTNVPMYNSCMNSRGWTFRTASDVANQTARAKAQVVEKSDRLSSINSQLSALCDKEEYKPFVTRTTCMYSDVMPLPKLADTSRITKNQKSAMEGYMQERDALLNEQERVLVIGADKSFIARVNCLADKVKPIQKKNELDLYKGQISWGQYNTQKNEMKVLAKRLCP